MSRFYLVMRAKGSEGLDRIEVDSDEFCQDHKRNPPLFHKVERQVDGRPYVYALRCPTSLTPEERSRLFPIETPASEIKKILKAQEQGDTREKTRRNYDEMGIALLAALFATLA